jgi:hypothetical protein
MHGSNNFTNTFDDIYGPDILSLKINNIDFYGYLDKSPIEEKLLSNFNYILVVDESKKPFRAHWMIYESKLFLLYCNGIINDKHLYTTDIFPDYPDTDLLLYNFTGILKFSIQQKEISGITDNFKKCDDLLITFENGILLKLEEIK